MQRGRVEGPGVVEGLVLDDEQGLKRGDRGEQDGELREFRGRSEGEAGHLRFGAGGLGRAAWAKVSRKSFSSRRGSSRSVATESISSARFMRTR